MISRKLPPICAGIAGICFFRIVLVLCRPDKDASASTDMFAADGQPAGGQNSRHSERNCMRSRLLEVCVICPNIPPAEPISQTAPLTGKLDRSGIIGARKLGRIGYAAPTVP